MAKNNKCIVDKINQGMSRTDAESMCEVAPPAVGKRRGRKRRKGRSLREQRMLDREL